MLQALKYKTMVPPSLYYYYKGFVTPLMDLRLRRARPANNA